MRTTRALGLAALLLSVSACMSSGPQQKVASADGQIKVEVRWDFKPEATATDVDAPKTHAWLVVAAMGDEQWLDLGAFVGDTFTVPAKADGIEQALTSASIWWAGGGDELVVQPSNSGELIVSHRTVDEEAGFGELVEVARVPVPSDSVIVVEQ